MICWSCKPLKRSGFPGDYDYDSWHSIATVDFSSSCLLSVFRYSGYFSVVLILCGRFRFMSKHYNVCFLIISEGVLMMPQPDSVQPA